MKIIGITGGVGAGKSTVLKALDKMCKCSIVMSDDVAKSLMKYNGMLSDDAIRIFGKDFYNADGSINTAYISRKMYDSPSLKSEWEGIVHPAANAKIRELISHAKQENMDFIFIESALLIENGYDRICDEIWYVFADSKIRRQRLKADRNYSDKKIDSIFHSQLSDETFRNNSDFVINTGCDMDDTLRQLENKLEQYKTL